MCLYLEAFNVNRPSIINYTSKFIIKQKHKFITLKEKSKINYVWSSRN